MDDRFDEEMSNFLPEIRDFLKQFHIINGVYSSPNGDANQELYKYSMRMKTKIQEIDIDHMDNTDIQLAYMRYYGAGMCPMEIFDEERM